MEYAATTGFIFYWKPDQNFVIHIYHHFWFDEYSSCLSIEYNHTPVYLILQQDPESIIYTSYLLNLIPCELDLTYNPLCDTTILTYEIELPPYRKKMCLNLLDDEYFTIPFISDIRDCKIFIIQ